MTTIEISIPSGLYEQVKVILAKSGMTVEEACELFIRETALRGDPVFGHGTGY
ncbi:MAG: hypothetical protein PHV32_00770 [Eubacteriales bacterium]|nr:hypothetical protein [Eubacteriales bacterium]